MTPLSLLKSDSASAKCLYLWKCGSKAPLFRIDGSTHILAGSGDSTFDAECTGLPVIRREQGPSFFGANPAQNLEGPALRAR